VKTNPALNWVRLFLMLLWIGVIILLFAGCAPAAKVVTVDAPKLAIAIMVLGCCAVACSLIGGVSLVKASRQQRHRE
jgi:hypothetical protein